MGAFPERSALVLARQAVASHRGTAVDRAVHLLQAPDARSLAAGPKLELILEPGFQSTTQRVSAANGGSALIRLHERMISDQTTAQNLAALKELLQLLKNRGVRVVLLTLPHHQGYSSNASDRWRKTFSDLLAAARSVLGDEMVWWNLDSSPEYTDADFMDGHHLNVDGAAKMSEWLRKSLADLDKE